MTLSRLLPLTALLTTLAVASAGARAGEPWEPFIGKYQGEGIADIGGNLVKRDLGVTIEGTKRGFSVAWAAVTRYEDGRVKRREMAIDFEPTRRVGIFESAMRKNTFGHRVPLDPMAGDPYFWARIVDKTLSVFGLRVTEKGGYDVRIYHRTLTDDGLLVKFKRLSEGEVLRTVEGLLARRR